MPFGLTNAPATFQRFINDVLREVLDQYCCVYLDDILIYSTTREEHTIHLRRVLTKLGEAGLYCKAEKCTFYQERVTFLGHVLSKEGITMDPSKIVTIRDWPELQNVKDVQSFLGFANYYRRFIKGFQRIAKPLIRLIRKN
jgi:Reverse transcriptase (RNA-dependent DNA polymerase)